MKKDLILVRTLPVVAASAIIYFNLFEVKKFFTEHNKQNNYKGIRRDTHQLQIV